jgi:hypothetical protein
MEIRHGCHLRPFLPQLHGFLFCFFLSFGVSFFLMDVVYAPFYRNFIGFFPFSFFRFFFFLFFSWMSSTTLSTATSWFTFLCLFLFPFLFVFLFFSGCHPRPFYHNFMVFNFSFLFSLFFYVSFGMYVCRNNLFCIHLNFIRNSKQR